MIAREQYAVAIVDGAVDAAATAGSEAHVRPRDLG